MNTKVWRCLVAIVAIVGVVMSVCAAHRVLCSNCKGKGYFHTKCVYCNGTGAVVCGSCNGSGIYRPPSGIGLPMVCDCHNGRKLCWHCTGTGLGTEQIECKQCKGHGSYLVED